MAVVNRYTNIEPARYNPMSLQELMMAPQYKRNQNDKLLEASSGLETEIAKIDPLDIHSDVAKQEQERLYNSINEQTDLLNKEGFNPNSKQNFLKLNKEYQTAISPTGPIGKINNAKKILDTNKKAHIDTAVKEGFTPEQALMNWKKHEQKYADEFKATGKVSPITELGNPEYVDYLDSATKIFKDAGFTERDLAGGLISQIITTDPKGQYVLNQGGGKITNNNIGQLQEAVAWLNNNINNPNSTMGQSIAYQGKTSNQVLSEIGNLAKVYIEDSQKNDYSRTITGFKSAKELGLNQEGNAKYITTDASNIKRFDSDLSTKLTEIIDNKVININRPTTNSVTPSNAAGFNAIGTTSTGFEQKKETASIENRLTDKQKKEYDDIYNILNTGDDAVMLISDKYDPAIVRKVNDYIQNTGNLLKQNAIIQDDFVKEYGTSTGATSKTRGEIDEYIKTNKSHLQYSYKGKEYSTFNELPDDVRAKFEKAKYVGYMSPKNFEGIHKESNKDLYVSPHVYDLYDEDNDTTEPLLVGRATGERNSPEFIADRDFNKIYQSKYRPKKEFYIPTIGVNVKYDNDSDMYILNDPKSGNKTSMDEISLQNWIYNYYGAK
tara:strand:- start:49649 stop:51472 length:1824 start_codon:yes stop_codon:yes gene_type:complete